MFLTISFITEIICNVSSVKNVKGRENSYFSQFNCINLLNTATVSIRLQCVISGKNF